MDCFMRTIELVKLLSEKGCSLIRHRKRHDEWYSPISGSTFMVPRHGNQEVPIGTLNSIKKQAGL